MNTITDLDAQAASDTPASPSPIPASPDETRVDQALEGTFPASDAQSWGGNQTLKERKARDEREQRSGRRADYLSRSPKSVQQAVKTLIEDVRILLDATREQGGEGVVAAQQNVTRSLAAARDSLQSAQRSITDQGRAVAKKTHEYVNDQPWRAAAISGVLGVLIGVWIQRRRSAV